MAPSTRAARWRLRKIVFKAHRRVYRSTLGWRVIRKKKKTPQDAWRIAVFIYLRCSSCSSKSSLCVESPDFVDFDFDLLDRIVGVSPCHPQARTGGAVLMGFETRESTSFLEGARPYARVSTEKFLFYKVTAYSTLRLLRNETCERGNAL